MKFKSKKHKQIQLIQLHRMPVFLITKSYVIYYQLIAKHSDMRAEGNKEQHYPQKFGFHCVSVRNGISVKYAAARYLKIIALVCFSENRREEHCSHEKGSLFQLFKREIIHINNFIVIDQLCQSQKLMMEKTYSYGSSPSTC